jgi:Tol biopolymer transport system component
VSNRDGNSEIYIMDADGNNETRLSDHAESDIEPSW